MSLFKPSNRNILNSKFIIMIARLWPLAIVNVIIFIICLPVIQQINEELAGKIWYGSGWPEFLRLLWIDITDWYPWLTLILILNIILTGIVAIIWVRMLMFRRLFQIYPWEQDPTDQSVFRFNVNVLIENAASNFHNAIDEQIKLTNTPYIYLKGLMDEGMKSVLHYRKSFWELHDLAQYFGLPVKDSFKDYLQK